jgi:hypothetical protein
MVSGTTSGLVGSRNQIYLKLKLGALPGTLPGIKNLNLNLNLIFLIFFLILNEKTLIKKTLKISNKNYFFATSV